MNPYSEDVWRLRGYSELLYGADPQRQSCLPLRGTASVNGELTSVTFVGQELRGALGPLVDLEITLRRRLVLWARGAVPYGIVF